MTKRNIFLAFRLNMKDEWTDKQRKVFWSEYDIYPEKKIFSQMVS